MAVIVPDRMYVQCEVRREVHFWLKSHAYKRGLTLRDLLTDILTTYWKENKDG
jgi:hypothetical protein